MDTYSHIFLDPPESLQVIDLGVMFTLGNASIESKICGLSLVKNITI